MMAKPKEISMASKTKKEGELLKIPAPVGKLPSGYDWCDASTTFPSKMFHDRDEPGRVWDGGWFLKGKQSSPPVGHYICGVPGTPFEGYVFVWAADGSHGGRWARPKGK